MSNIYIQEALNTLKTLQEDNWVDEETGKEFLDYGTGTIKNPPEDIFDITTTRTSFYDDLLPSSPEETRKLIQRTKNLIGKIVYLSPREYYDICAKEIFDKSPEYLEMDRGSHSSENDTINKVIFKYKRQLPLTWIDFTTGGQEGLHRMRILANAYGWDVKYPVLIVDWYDKELAKEPYDEEKDFILDRIKSICDELLKYTYTTIDEFIKNIEHNLSEVEHSITKNEDGSVTVTVYDVDYTINPEDIPLEKPKKLEPDNLDNIDELIDIDLEDFED